jgi:hypothetical protein
MTKKEIKNAINKAVYQYAESLGYTMSDDNDGSYVTFFKADSNTADDSIDYSRSRHETYIANWANEKVKADGDLIDLYVKEQMSKFN